jgi:D-amino peptidase
VKVYISVDMEGVAGIVDWAQCTRTGEDYAIGRHLVLGEVNAVITGALAAGATEILVNDAHSVMRNLVPGQLAGGASYLSGSFKPWYMMQGLDGSFAAVIFLGYHAAMATPGILGHTYNPRAIAEVRIDGTPTGEAGLNALVAQHFAVPVALITGDQYVGPEAEPFCPGIRAVQVKQSISRYAAENLHPNRAHELLTAGTHAALTDLPGPPEIPMPCRVEVDFLSPDMAEQSTWVRGVERVNEGTVRFTDDDPLRLHRTFLTLVYLTRSLMDPR